MNFNTVWISSKKHLEQFKAIRDNASFLEKFFLGLRVPPNFPSVTTGFHTFPVVFTDSGNLEITEDEFKFKSEPPSEFMNSRYLNLTPRDFKIALTKITNIDYFNPNAAFMRALDFPFIQLQTSDDYYHEVLFCCGGLGPRTNKIKHDTEELKQYLENKLG